MSFAGFEDEDDDDDGRERERETLCTQSHTNETMLFSESVIAVITVIHPAWPLFMGR